MYEELGQWSKLPSNSASQFREESECREAKQEPEIQRLSKDIDSMIEAIIKDVQSLTDRLSVVCSVSTANNVTKGQRENLKQPTLTSLGSNLAQKFEQLHNIHLALNLLHQSIEL